VFLIADSAVTSTDPLHSSRTSFGETHVREKRCGIELSVEERALKVYRCRHLAVTCSGDATAIQKFAHLLNQRTEIAFRNAVANITDPDAVPQFQALMATYVDGQPKVYAFNKVGDATVTDEHGIVHLGRASASYHELVEESAQFIERNYAQPERRLVCMLSSARVLLSTMLYFQVGLAVHSLACM
jgi:hypothetical protein